jgi:tetratricopeptide (TPR) repeat protein
LSIFRELKRRNVLRAGVGYLTAAWLLIQLADTLFPLFDFPDVARRVLVIVLAICFVPALLAAWLFELTPAGLKRESSATDGSPGDLRTTRLLDRVIIAVLALAVVVFAVDRFVLEPTRDVPVVSAPQPVSVVIADLSNETGDAAFDRTLEPLLKIVLEGADFVSAYDRSQITRLLGTSPPEPLNESAARQIALTHGLGVVLSGSLKQQGTGYEVTARAVETVTGTEIRAVRGTAPDKERVLSVTTSLVSQIRQALGDDESQSDSAQRFALETLSSTSLDVVRAYAEASEGASNGSFEDALRAFTRAIELDPNFGLAHAGAAMMSSNLGHASDAERYVNEALRHIDSMTARERYRTRGIFYVISDDYESCVGEYSQLIARNSADVAAHNNLAVCAAAMGDYARAVAEVQQAIKVLPRRALYRVNLGLYAASAGDFQTAVREGQAAKELGNPLGLLPVALGQVALGRLDEAAVTYEELSAASAQGAAFATSGLGDLAFYRGRFDEAVRILEQGAEADLSRDLTENAAWKLSTLADVQLQRRDLDAAVSAAERAIALDTDPWIRYVSARALAHAGSIDRARTIADSLRSERGGTGRAFAKSLDGEILRLTGAPDEAIRALSEAISVREFWLARFDLGRAYLDASAFAQADSQFEWCVANRGDILSTGNEPSYGRYPLVFYYRGNARKGLNSAGFVDSYRTYLGIREAAGEDPILPEVRQLVEF